MSDAFEDVESDAVSALSKLASQLDERHARIKELEAELKAEKEAMYELSDQHIPALMEELGVKKLQLQNGAEVSVTSTYGGHIKADNMPQAFAWLRDNGFDDIIKNEIKLNFGKGEDTSADKVYNDLVAQGYQPSNKEFVHPQTLKAFIRERIEAGDDFPMQTFGAHIGARAKIKPAKK